MWNKRFVLLACVALSLAGVLALFFVSYSIPAKRVSISAISPEYAGRPVIISGVARFAEQSGKYSLLLVCSGSACVDVVVRGRFGIVRGSRVVVQGRVDSGGSVFADADGVDSS